ncbi:type II secretion system protein N [Noviherbaspirillum sedimenti]|uniref:Type II secretion system protein N n=2 Tax=Noviherbaspirillum sedimenti TaxID=2320865 RepID=A0A3A3G650_9BURK|nr:type II secretion system protein N [Noviherbaspirillum sedimenti]RJG03411.1 type II secretion system protein N [Noviherbaspirillum sedimenti]
MVSRLMLWFLAGIVTIALTMLVFLPASWMAFLLEQQTGGRLTLGDVQGTLWRGSAFLGAAPSGRDPVVPLLPGRFGWRLSPLVLIGKTKLTVENATVLSQPLTVEGSWRSWRVGSAALNLPAERLASLGAPLNTIQPAGTMRLSWSQLQLAREGQGIAVQGTMMLEMRDVSSRLSPVKPLGAYVLAFDWQGQQAQMTLKTVKGPMLLSGSGMLTNGRLRFSGVADAEAGQEERLGNLLNLLGQRRREGNKNVIALEFK